MIKRVYVDTSVVGGMFDNDFSEDTSNFFQAVFDYQFVIIISDLLEAEVARGPSKVRDFLKSIESKHVEQIKLTAEAAELADRYVQANVVGKTSKADC